MMFLDAFKNEPALMNDPQAVRDSIERASRLGTAKLDIPDRHLTRTAPTICEISEPYQFLEMTPPADLPCFRLGTFRPLRPPPLSGIVQLRPV
jgi:hypothetical protein